jgi:hypothetical protein
MLDIGFGRHEHRRRRDGISMGIDLPVPDRSSHIDGPVAGAVDVGTAPAFEGLIGADLVAEIVQLPILGGQLIAEFVFEPLALEIADIVELSILTQFLVIPFLTIAP